ncbi:unnamed protein product, partial [Symbiodinium microadriaticum]
WLTTDQVWTRQKWCRQTKRLVPDKDGQGIPHADLLSSIDFLLVNLKGDIIHQFHSTTKLKTLEGENAQVATFLMSISLRGQRAYEVHLHFLNLIGVSALQLIGHYTVLVRDCSDFVLDDDAEPKIADQGIKDDTSTSMYIVVACRSDSPGVPMDPPPCRHEMYTPRDVREKYTPQERWLASQLTLLDMWAREMSRDFHILQDRMDHLAMMMDRIILRLPQGLVAPGRNKVQPPAPPSELDTLDD